MKLSEVIRKGSRRVRKQTFGELFDWNEDGKLVAACVLGTAMLGYDPKYISDSDFQTFKRKFPILRKEMEIPKVLRHYGDYPETLQDILIKFNDKLRYPRYRIARWLENKGL